MHKGAFPLSDVNLHSANNNILKKDQSCLKVAFRVNNGLKENTLPF